MTEYLLSTPLLAFISWWLWTFRKPAETRGNPPISDNGY